jgi:N-acetylmuramoyl-L-alanine amidase
MDIIDAPASTLNYRKRKRGTKPLFIILHDTGGSAESAINWFQNNRSGVSAHYIVGVDGKIYRCVPDDHAAWHAGTSEFMGYENLNDWSLGIEIEDKSDDTPYPDAQLEALLDLSESLIIQYHIPLNRIIGHCDIAIPRGRKVDPGKDWDWWSYLLVLGARIAEKEFSS